MKFIFPKNYNFKSKLFGVFDFSTVLLNFIWDSFIFIIVKIFIPGLEFKISFFIVFCFPLLLFSFFGFQGENIVSIIFYVAKFFLKQKVYLFIK